MAPDTRDDTVTVAADSEVVDASIYAELVAELALSFADDRSPQTRTPLVEQIIAGAIAVIPGVIAAAVETLDRDGRLTAPIMVGDQVARDLMNAQNRDGEGPCLDALRDNKQVSSSDLSREVRWPAFATEAIAAGVHALVCTPMEVSGRSVGVLSLLSDQVDFGDHDEDTEGLARVFAAHAALALTGARQAGDMNAALSSREVIGQAKGILMERFKVTPDVAFAILVRASSVTNTKLRAVCEKLCETGWLPEGSTDRAVTR